MKNLASASFQHTLQGLRSVWAIVRASAFHLCLWDCEFDRHIGIMTLRPRLHGTGRIWDRSEIRPFSPVYTWICPVRGSQICPVPWFSCVYTAETDEFRYRVNGVLFEKSQSTLYRNSWVFFEYSDFPAQGMLTGWFGITSLTDPSTVTFFAPLEAPSSGSGWAASFPIQLSS